MKSLIAMACLAVGSASAQTMAIDCSRAPAYTADLERLIAQANPDPSIWRMSNTDAIKALSSRVTGRGHEAAQQQRDVYESYTTQLKTMMWTVREQCPGS